MWNEDMEEFLFGEGVKFDEDCDFWSLRGVLGVVLLLAMRFIITWIRVRVMREIFLE